MDGKMVRDHVGKSQSAMEYLMTYGWAILIIAVVLGALYSLGIFNGANFLGGTCVASPGYLCSNPLMATDGTLSLIYGYQGPNVTIAGFACTNTTTAPSSFASSGSSNLEPGQEESVSVSCPLSSSATIGTPYSGYLWVEYDQAGQSDLIARFATVREAVTEGSSSSLSLVGNVQLSESQDWAAYDSGNGYVYVTSSDYISVLSGLSLVGNILISSGDLLTSIYDPSNGYVYVPSAQNTGNIYIVSGTSLIKTETIGGALQFGTYDSGNGYVYVTDWGTGTVAVISGTSIMSNVPVQTDPESATYDSGNGYVYVPNFGSSSVSVISGTSLVTNVPVQTYPEFATYDPNNGYLYVSNSGSSSVSIISGTSVITTVPTASEPLRGAYDPSNGYVYISNNNALGSVSVFSGTSLIANIPVVSNPDGILYNPGNGYIYVSGTGTEVSVISGTSLVGNVAVGGSSGIGTYDSGNGYVYIPNGSGVVSVLT